MRSRAFRYRRIIDRLDVDAVLADHSAVSLRLGISIRHERGSVPFRLAFLAKARDWASLTSAWRHLDDAMMDGGGIE